MMQYLKDFSGIKGAIQLKLLKDSDSFGIESMGLNFKIHKHTTPSVKYGGHFSFLWS